MFVIQLKLELYSSEKKRVFKGAMVWATPRPS